MAVREIDPGTGMPYEAAGSGMGISSGDDDRYEETAEEVEARILQEIQAARALAAEPKRETRQEREDRIRAELVAKDETERRAEAMAEAARSNGAAEQAVVKVYPREEEPPARNVPLGVHPDAMRAHEQKLSEQAAVKRPVGRPRKVEPQLVPGVVPKPAASMSITGSSFQSWMPNLTADAPADAALAALFERNAGKGLNFEERDLTIPRLNLLQDGSPQCKSRLPEYIDGAAPGLWLNMVTRELMPTALIVPVSYKRRYVGWYPRGGDGSGGGLARMDVPKSEYDDYEETAIGVHSYMSEVEVRTGNKSQTVQKLVDVVETPEWVVLLLDPAGKGRPQPCAISFPRTKAAAANQMNTIIMMQVEIGSDGKEYELPSFSNVFRIGSVSTGEGSESYFIPTIEHMGRVTRLDIAERAAKLHDQFDAGRVKVAEDVGV